MSDFFGGILDSISHVGDDVTEFFNSSIGQAVAKGGAAGLGMVFNPETGTYEPAKQGGSKDDTNYNMSISNRYSAGTADPATKAADFTNIEQEWLSRLRDFAGLSDSTKTKLGGI